MRVLIGLPGLGGGGAEHVTVGLVGALRAQGHVADIFVARAEGPLLGRAREVGDVIEGGAPPRGVEWRPAVVARLARHASRYDVVVAGLELQTSVAVAVAARRAGRACVCHVHCVLPEFLALAARARGPLAPLARMSHRAYRPFYARQGAIIACSREAREGVVAVGARPGAVHVVPNGADCTRVRAGAAHPRRPGGRVILGVGGLREIKGFDRLIGVLPHLPPDVRLVLVGDGPARAALARQAAALGVADRVTFTGYQPNPHAWMAGAAVLAISSRTEAHPLVAGEAACLGLPVVVWEDLPGVREVLGGPAPMIGAGSAAAAAARLSAVLDGPRRPPRGAPWTMAEMAGACERIYAEALTAHATRRGTA